MAKGGMYPYVAHGEALAAVYPAVLAEILNPTFSGKSRSFAAEATEDAVGALIEKIGLNGDLGALGIPDEEDVRDILDDSRGRRKN